MTDVVLKAVSPTMEKGTLARWLVSVGSEVTRGQVLAEIETDKASVELESEHDGVVSQLLVPAGTADVPVGTVLARVGGEAVAKAQAPAVQVRETSVQAPEAAVQAQAPVVQAPVETPRAPAAAVEPARDVLATPLVRRLARKLGIDLARITGTGEHGRITKRDLESVEPRLGERPALTRSSKSPEEVMPPARNVPHEVVAMSGMRKTIARRLSESKRVAPHFYMSMDAELDTLLALRKQLNARGKGTALSVNDFVIRALAMSLDEVKAANVQYGGDVTYRYQRVDISVAVAVPEGLYTPVIRDAARKSVSAIAAEMQSLAERARAGKLKLEDFEGGTFSLSNLGMYGVKQFEAVINPPQAGILAVGAAEKRVLPADDGGVRVGTQCTLTLSCDHRVIDGAVGAELLAAIKTRLEDPLGLLVD